MTERLVQLIVNRFDRKDYVADFNIRFTLRANEEF